MIQQQKSLHINLDKHFSCFNVAMEFSNLRFLDFCFLCHTENDSNKMKTTLIVKIPSTSLHFILYLWNSSESAFHNSVNISHLFFTPPPEWWLSWAERKSREKMRKNTPNGEIKLKKKFFILFLLCLVFLLSWVTCLSSCDERVRRKKLCGREKIWWSFIKFSYEWTRRRQSISMFILLILSHHCWRC